MIYSGDVKELEEIKVDEQIQDLSQLILFNDDVNTFDHVINMLVQVCDHDHIQAEQCAIIVHYKGKCTVKTGELKDLEPMCVALLDAGLSAEIQ